MKVYQHEDGSYYARDETGGFPVDQPREGFTAPESVEAWIQDNPGAADGELADTPDQIPGVVEAGPDTGPPEPSEVELDVPDLEVPAGNLRDLLEDGTDLRAPPSELDSPLDVPCGSCGQAAGDTCLDADGKFTSAHEARETLVELLHPDGTFTAEDLRDTQLDEAP